MTDKEKTIAVQKLVLCIGKKELVLSVDEARELKKALESVLGKEVVHHYSGYNYPYWWGGVVGSGMRYGYADNSSFDVNAKGLDANLNQTTTGDLFNQYAAKYGAGTAVLCLSEPAK